MTSERYKIDHISGTRRLYNASPGTREQVVFLDAERNGNNTPFKVRPSTAGFLAARLGELPGCR
jgi:hypothetical protein